MIYYILPYHRIDHLLSNRLVFTVIMVILVIVSSCILIQIQTASADTSKYDVPNKPNAILTISVYTEKGEQKMLLPLDKALFNIIPHYEPNGKVKSITMKLKPDFGKTYQNVGYPSKSEKIVYVYPIFTQAAYANNGFYDYYNKKCDTTCLTVPIPLRIQGTYSSSITAAFTLSLLNYTSITDIDIDKNPDILKKYDKVIILHNEYVTQKEFDAITHHSNVVYLFPNALYAKVNTDYQQGIITLIKGHGYPNADVSNGFGWKDDSSKYEYDFQCYNWHFYPAKNGKMLNCYPNYRILYDQALLQEIKSQ